MAAHVGSAGCLQAGGLECELIGGEREPRPPLVGAECEPKTPRVCEPTCHCLQAATDRCSECGPENALIAGLIYFDCRPLHVGLITPDTDLDAGKKTYAYDPHLDPQLVWAGKAEHTSSEVPTVSLHVHERIDPRTIIEAVKRPLSLFATPKENPPIRQAIEFYKHKHNWSYRLIAGDSLLVMNSLLEKEGMAGQIQMVYIDPPYGITDQSIQN